MARRLLIIVPGAAAVPAVGWYVGRVLGYGSFAFAITVHMAMMAWMSASLGVSRPALRGDWFRVRAWEPGLYRRLGVWRYMRVLRHIGWERLMRANRPFDGTRSSLAAFERETRMAELGHLILAVIGTVLVAVAVVFGVGPAIAWLASLNLVLHVYPVMLQRALRARIERTLAYGRSTNTPQPR